MNGEAGGRGWRSGARGLLRRLTPLRLRRLARRILPTIDANFPRVVVVRGLDPTGWRFELTNAVEAHRVVDYGDEKEFISQVLGELDAGDVFFDIGSCVGLVAIHALGRGAEVVAFEPDPGFRARLQRNLELNSATDRVTAVGWAVSDRDGTTTLYSNGVDGLSPSLSRTSAGQSAIEVPTSSLDLAIVEGALPRPDVIKMDVEDAEGLVLDGMKQLLSKTPPRAIFMEIHPSFLPTFGRSVDEVRGSVQAAGYSETFMGERNEQLHYSFHQMNQVRGT